LPGLAVGAAVAEARKHQRHQRQPVEPRRELRDPAIVRPQHADWRRTLRKLGRVGKKPCRRHDDRNVIGDGRVIDDAHIGISDDAAVLNERHRRAP
jgi:hypothetical protein